MKLNNDFNTAFVKFLMGAQAIVDKNLEKFEYHLPVELVAEKGRKFIRIVSKDAAQRSAYCFIDMTNGNVLKAAGWKGPAKHARGNIFNDDSGVGAVGPYGANYMS